MDYQHLLSRLLRNAPFASRDDAQRALVTTLETLGYVLPSRLIEELRDSLPAECEVALELGMRLRSSRPVASDVGQTQHLLNSLPWFTMDRIQDVCSVLGELLAPSLSEEITAQLPGRLVEAFVPRSHAPACAASPWDRSAGNDLETRRIRRPAS